MTERSEILQAASEAARVFADFPAWQAHQLRHRRGGYGYEHPTRVSTA